MPVVAAVVRGSFPERAMMHEQRRMKMKKKFWLVTYNIAFESRTREVLVEATNRESAFEVAAAKTALEPWAKHVKEARARRHGNPMLG
jgi:hypothetical protein